MHTFTTVRDGLILYEAFDGCKQGVISAHTPIPSGMNLGAMLAHQDVATYYFFAAVFFNAQALALTVSSIEG